MAHNGKKLQLNPWFLSAQAEFPFLNFMKLAPSWQYANNSGSVDWAETDANGYPTVARNLGVRALFPIPSQTDRPGNYILAWSATDSVTMGLNTSGSHTGSLSGATGRVVVTTTDTTFSLQVNAMNAGATFNSIYVCHANDEAALLAGGVFQTDALNLYKQFGVIRFLDWGPFNVSTVATSSDFKPESYFSYLADQYPSQYLAGTTTHSGNVYSATLGGYALADKSRAILKFDVDQTFTTHAVTFTNGSATIGWTAHGFVGGERLTFLSNSQLDNGLPLNFVALTYYVSLTNLATNTFEVSKTAGGTSIVAGSAGTAPFTGYVQSYLNVNGTGAKPILSPWGGPRTTGGGGAGNIADIVFGGFWSHCIYDAALDGYIVNNGQFNSFGITNGVPPSIMIRLCNEIGAHPWFPMPFLACDGTGNIPTLTNYINDLAVLCKNTLLPGLIPRFEVIPNECWNSLFWGTIYGYLRQHLRSGAVKDSNNWAGMVASLVAQIISGVYGNDRTKYQAVCGFQTTGLYPGQSAKAESTWFVTQGGSAAKNWLTHFCIAGYWNSFISNSATEVTLADAYAGGDQSALNTYVAGCVGSDSSTGFPLGYLQSLYTSWQSSAAGLALKVCQYEGDYSPTDYNSTAHVNAMREASKFHQNITAYTEANYYNFLNAGTNCEFPSVYCSSGANAPWTMMDPSIYATPTPRMIAIQLFNSRRRRMALSF